MSKNKLAGIIVGCTVAIVLVIVLVVPLLRTPTQTPKHALSISISPSGAGSVSPSGGEYESGTEVTLTASPASGYRFVNWTGDVGSIANFTAASTTIMMQGNYTITANFEVIPPEVKSVSLTDPTNDLFDKSGNPIEDQPYLDIVGAEVTTSGSDYIARIILNGSLPTQTPDPQIFLEWDVYVDSDCNISTGSVWPIVTNDLGFEYAARLCLLDSNYTAQLFDFKIRKTYSMQYTITGNIIELRWPQAFYQTDKFNFIVAAKKYGERGAGTAFMLADKAPNQGHDQFP